MNKKYIMTGLLLLLSVMAVTAEPIYVSKTVYATIPDEDIASYMVSTFALSSYTILPEGVHIYYDYTAVEPYNDTHIAVMEMQTPTWLAYDDLTFCQSLGYDIDTCANFLINHDVEIVIPVVVDGETINRTIVPTYVQAINVGLAAYNHAVEMKNNIAKKVEMQTLMTAALE